MKFDKSLKDGAYAKKQIFCSDGLIAFSHTRRFQYGLELAKTFEGQKILDYGFGDGTFLAMLMDSVSPPAACVGAEISDSLVDAAKGRFAQRAGLSFVLTSDLVGSEHEAAYDGVFCMEVLEHVVQLEPVLETLQRVLKPGGTLVVSVPVEIGFPLLVKQTARRIAGWRKLGDYSFNARYTLRELVASIFAGDEQHMPRPVYGLERAIPHHDHQGFNWKSLLRILRARFELEDVSFSPLNWAGPQLASQAWFRVHKKAG
jgi:SAM-dependent methyltransferase